jgi:hypothetical protein
MQVIPTDAGVKDSITTFLDKLPHAENINPEMECVICKGGFFDEESKERTYQDVKLSCAENCTQSVYHRECLETWIRMNPQKNAHCVYCQTNFSIHIPLQDIVVPVQSIKDWYNLLLIRLTYVSAFVSMIIFMYNGICTDRHRVETIYMYLTCGILELTSCTNVPSIFRIHELTERYLYIRLFISCIVISCMSLIIYNLYDETPYIFYDTIALGLSSLYVVSFLCVKIRLLFA